jgi:hypothetical protein
MSERMSIEVAKEFWFGDDLTVFADIGPNGTVIALPAREAARGLNYLAKLQACTTYEAAEELFLQFAKDPSAPKLIPRIIDPMSDYEYIDELFTKFLLGKGVEESEHLDFVDQEMSLREYMESHYNGNWLPHEYDDEFRNLAEHIVRTEVPFVWNTSPPYLDDNLNFAACRNAEQWTDAWMPAEITTAIGVPDTGYGIDYYEADYIYPSLEKFVAVFTHYGFKVVSGDEKFSTLFKSQVCSAIKRDAVQGLL